MDIKEQDILGPDIHRHWYYAAKADAMRRLLGPAPIDHVLDVGAGSGFFSRFLLERGAANAATCVDPGYEREHEETIAGRPLRFVRGLDRSTADVVLMMDVIEHVDDDVGLMRHYAGLVPPGARVLVTVPAFAWMWSGHDVFLEHRRRYTLAQLERAVTEAGLGLRLGCYLYGLTLPIAAARRLGGRLVGGGHDAKSSLTRHSPPVNWALRVLCALEAGLLRRNRIAGLTAAVLAETRPPPQ